MTIHALVEFHMLGLANFKYSMYSIKTVFVSTLTSTAISEYVCPALKRSMILFLPLNNNKLFLLRKLFVRT